MAVEREENGPLGLRAWSRAKFRPSYPDSALQVYRSKMDGEATSPLPRARSGPLPSSSGSSSSSSQLSVATLGRSPSPKVRGQCRAVWGGWQGKLVGRMPRGTPNLNPRSISPRTPSWPRMARAACPETWRPHCKTLRPSGSWPYSRRVSGCRDPALGMCGKLGQSREHFHPRTKELGGTPGRALALHLAHLSSIPSTLYGSQIPGVQFPDIP